MDKRGKGCPDLGKDKEPWNSMGKSIFFRLIEARNKAREKGIYIINYLIPG